MLYSIDSGKYVATLPHKKDFDRWMKNLNRLDYDVICEELNRKINGNDVNTSSWIPGNDWTNTVYEPIYNACKNNVDLSGLFFGLILFELLMNKKDAVWGFGRYEKDGIPIRGTTYFILHNPPVKTQ